MIAFSDPAYMTNLLHVHLEEAYPSSPTLPVTVGRMLTNDAVALMVDQAGGTYDPDLGQLAVLAGSAFQARVDQSGVVGPVYFQDQLPVSGLEHARPGEWVGFAGLEPGEVVVTFQDPKERECTDPLGWSGPHPESIRLTVEPGAWSSSLFVDCGTDQVTCNVQEDCPQNQYCAKPIGECDEAEPGHCRWLPSSEFSKAFLLDGATCPPEPDEPAVCACGGVAYPSQCAGALDRVFFTYPGFCS